SLTLLITYCREKQNKHLRSVLCLSSRSTSLLLVYESSPSSLIPFHLLSFLFQTQIFKFSLLKLKLKAHPPQNGTIQIPHLRQTSNGAAHRGRGSEDHFHRLRPQRCTKIGRAHV